MIRFACPSCGRQFEVPEEKVGSRGTCPACRAPITVPATVLAERALKLERENRGLKIGVSALSGLGVLNLLATVVLALRSPGTPKDADSKREGVDERQSPTASKDSDDRATMVSAEAFELRDGQGRVRARLAMSEGDRPTLTFLHEDGAGSVEVGIQGGDSSGMRVFDRQGKPRTLLLVGQEGPALLMINEDGELGLTMKIDGRGSPRLTYYRPGAPEAKPGASFYLLPKGDAQLSLASHDEEFQVLLSAVNGLGAGLMVKGSSGEVAVTANSMSAGLALQAAGDEAGVSLVASPGAGSSLLLLDGVGRSGVWLSSDPGSTPILRVQNSAGRVLWRAP